MTDLTIRQARTADEDAVAAFASDTWDRFEDGDYLPRVFPEWVASDGPDQQTFVAEANTEGEEEGDVVGVCQCTLLSEHEAWAQGLRVAPAHRGRGIAAALNRTCFDWARERGAAVCRVLVFSWNAAGLGTARGVGFEPCTEFRWARPVPGAEAEPAAESDDLTVTDDAGAAWSAWRRSDACAHLRGLGLDPGESWALSEVTRERVAQAADEGKEGAVIAVQDDDGARAVAVRTATQERDGADGTTVRAEYGASAWTDFAAGAALFDAVRRDAGALGADEVRVMIPETVRHVSDVAALGVGVSDEPEFVLEADLTGE